MTRHSDLRLSLVHLLSRVLSFASASGFGIVSAWCLGAAGRGTYAWSNSLVTFGSVFLTLTLYHSSQFLVAKSKKNLPGLLGNVGMLTGMQFLLLAASAVVCIQLLGQSQSPRLLVVTLWLWSQTLFMLTSGLFFGLGWTLRAYFFETLANSLALAILLLAQFQGTVDVQLALSGRCLSVLLVALTMFGLLVSGGGGKISPSRSLFLEGWQYGRNGYVIGVCVVLIWNQDQVLVAWLIDEAAAGRYGLAVNLVSPLLLVPHAMHAMLFPGMAQMQTLAQRVQRIVPFLLAGSGLLLVLGLGVAAFSRFFLIRVFGLDFAPTVPLVYWLLPGIWAWSTQILVGLVMTSWALPGRYTGLFLGVTVLNFCLTTSLLGTLGLAGAAIASSLTNITLLCATALYVAAQLRRESTQAST